MSNHWLQQLRDPRWQKKRLIILERDGWKCQECGATDKNLQVDHLIYAPTGRPWDVEDKDLRTLCDGCHRTISELRKIARAYIGDLGIKALDALVDFMVLKGILKMGAGPIPGRAEEILAEFMRAP